ncbi:MAG: hypothetical protein ACD_51C00337G0007 [uncultured bacterium]|nr:MAG: hypothetical protein ACD_51C00337G0007 [uncultured bacterium]OGJ47380.1 MAG: 50S ribosomal protein L31 [Candidatus Peregrinibacteria bacterium RIFOXYA2_FULL_41_18]OGJ49074.1 MAG: 50S ribosomal protein L31 [Candidatus Peregrinibacteria bacterium RIFOXYB12_FULL_41_12]OGJ52538.1 MAG: 50S ribosomal protein L31 [Candidatus Peregrinibacteria bacterium RIFOXYC2_FULL_41_22]OGJ54378.1 MAG: 50S ribosomal protein L31 [Candidatus Peregrinibacteria bacterium RIFOXYB2_FULL_41_88]
MKKDGVHPQYTKDAKITCSCGHVITIGSTKKELHTELCSACHPFYTGQQKLVDTAGRVDKFRNKLEAAKKAREAAATKTPKKRKKTMTEKVNEKLQKETEKTEE